MADKTILVVDYDPVFRASLIDIFNGAGYKAYGASDGRSAIGIAESLGSAEVDLMILEMNLPDMTGVALIDAISVQQKTIVKVIAASSLFSQAEMDNQRSFHADAEIRKEASTALASKWLLTARSLLGELADPARALSSYFILVVDDDGLVRHFVKVILNGAGYQVLEAADGESALVLARRLAGAVDLVVTDVEMPGMGGRAFGKAIRQERAHVPVLYMSGLVKDPDLADLNQPEQGLAFIAKPFLPKALLEIVSLMLNQAKRTG
jgi:CheY-like chemotaxis protein